MTENKIIIVVRSLSVTLYCEGEGVGEEERDVWSFSFPCTPSTCISVTISLSIHNVIPFLFLLYPNTATGTAITTAPRRVSSLISYDVLTI